MKLAAQTCKLDLTQYLPEDLIGNCVLGESKSEAYMTTQQAARTQKSCV